MPDEHTKKIDTPTTSGNALIQSSIENTVERYLRKILLEKGNELLQSNADSRILTDQTIDPEHAGRINELDRLPDVVRTLKEFSGNRAEFTSWRKSVDRIFGVYSAQQGTPKHYGILVTVRSKIVGEADAVLESYNTPLNWQAIAQCLTDHFADRRDLKTLEYQLYTLSQRGKSIDEFYQTVYYHLSLILNQINNHDSSSETLKALTKIYRDKALDTFIRGLNGDLPRLLAIKEPTDLKHALHLCRLIENQSIRNAVNPNKMPFLPPRNNQQSQRFQNQHLSRPNVPQFVNRNNFNPNLYHLPKPNFTSQPTNFVPRQTYQQPQQFFNAPPRPSAPKPQPPPQPMEVDSSIRTRNINYMNRPDNNQFAGKRPLSSRVEQIPNKFQRQFHINTGETLGQVTDNQAYNEASVYDEIYANAYAQYMDEQNYLGEMEEQGMFELPSETDTTPNDDTPVETADMAELNFLA